MNKSSWIFLSLILPTLLFIISIFVLYAQSMDDVFAGDLAIALSIFFGFVSLALAVLFGISDKVRDFLLETKSQIDEKISMLYVHAMSVKNWKAENINTEYMMRRILFDIDSICRIRKSIKDEAQLGALITAQKILTSELKSCDFNTEITRIQTIFE